MYRKIFCGLLLYLVALISQAQQETRVGDTITCNFQQGIKVQYVSTYSKPNLKPSNNTKSNSLENIFEVKYSNFPPEAEQAFSYAISIWEDLINSPVKIRVFANWTVLQNTNTLGFVVPTEIKNFENAPVKDIWYPMALAEKIAGKDLNSISEADIVATFNAGRTDFYFGIDGNCPSDQFDFVTIILHEIGHGLGMSGTLRISNNNGFYGLNDGNPKIYDNHIINGLGEYVAGNQMFPNGTFELAQQITSNSLVFESEIAALFNQESGGSYPRIFAPSPYAPGSSISHLDETSYNNTINSLMTPFVSRGEVQHNPGFLIKGMFYDMGWLHTYIDHDHLTDIEDPNEIEFSIGVVSDTILNENKILLNYMIDEDTEIFSVELLRQSDTDNFSIKLDDIPPESKVSYFFTVEDNLGRQYRYPVESNQIVSFYYGKDVVPPTLSHQPITDIVHFQTLLNFTVISTDNLGVGRVYMEVKTEVQTESDYFDLEHVGENLYAFLLDITSYDISSENKLQYRIYVEDISINENTTTYPVNGYQVITFKELPATGTYTNDFSGVVNDFFGDFSILSLSGFTSPSIHTEHPYPKSNSDIERLDLFYYLLVPLIINDEDSFLEFQEVALIEPGEENDYVVVEASNLDDTWVEITPRYDASRHDAWLTRFNSNLREGDSRATGDLNLLRENKIDLHSYFNEGDTIFIRFKLSSDHQRNGWGWMIDDLKFQDIQVGLMDNPEVESNFRIFPNPVSSKLYLNINEFDNEGGIFVELLSVRGEKVYSKEIQGSTAEIDVINLPNSVYILKIITKDEIISRRIIVLKD